MGFVLGKLRKRRRNGFAVETPEFSIAVTLVFFLFLSILVAAPMEQKFISTVDT